MRGKCTSQIDTIFVNQLGSNAVPCVPVTDILVHRLAFDTLKLVHAEPVSCIVDPVLDVPVQCKFGRKVGR